MNKEKLSTIIQSKWGLIGLALFVLIIVVVPMLFTKNGNGLFLPGTTPTPVTGSTALLTTSPQLITSQLAFHQYGNYVNIDLDSGTDTVSGVQLVISYDPKVLTNVKVVPATYFDTPTILANNVDTDKGIITYTAFINQQSTPIKGKGTVAAITYNMATDAQGKSTTLSFLPQTKVTVLGVNASVLHLAKSISLQ